MTLLSVVKDVCAAVGVIQPVSIFSGITGNRTMQEMLSLANEMAQRIAYDGRDWTKLRATAVLTGDGVLTDEGWVGTTAFSLPANYKRMLLNSNVWRSTSSQTPMRFISDTEEWMHRRAGWSDDSSGEWTMYGGKIHIYPVMSAFVPAVPAVPEDIGPPYVPAQPARPAVAATTAYFAYLDKNCIDLAGGGRGDVFQTDLDTFTLDERVLKLGMIAQWKAQKGSPYAEDMGTFGDALTMASGHDSPAPIIIGRGTRGGRVAIPTQTLYFPGGGTP